jgi:hypothetical protein
MSKLEELLNRLNAQLKDRMSPDYAGDRWGVWCVHGEHIIVRNPENPDGLPGKPLGAFVEPWPCKVSTCTKEGFEL